MELHPTVRAGVSITRSVSITRFDNPLPSIIRFQVSEPGKRGMIYLYCHPTMGLNDNNNYYWIEITEDYHALPKSILEWFEDATGVELKFFEGDSFTPHHKSKLYKALKQLMESLMSI